MLYTWKTSERNGVGVIVRPVMQYKYGVLGIKYRKVNKNGICRNENSKGGGYNVV